MGSLVENACRLLHEWAQGKQWELPQASGKEPSSRRPTTTRRGEQQAPELVNLSSWVRVPMGLGLSHVILEFGSTFRDLRRS